MTTPQPARDALIHYATTTRTITADNLAPLIEAVAAEVRDEQSPGDHETLHEAAQMYRHLRPVIERTMTEPDRWDGDEDESFHLGRYVQWLAGEREQVRAEELTQAADYAESLRQFEKTTGARWSAQVSENVGILRVADGLRRRAAEAASR